jgi:hypothetical protein
LNDAFTRAGVHAENLLEAAASAALHTLSPSVSLKKYG